MNARSGVILKEGLLTSSATFKYPGFRVAGLGFRVRCGPAEGWGRTILSMLLPSMGTAFLYAVLAR